MQVNQNIPLVTSEPEQEQTKKDKVPEERNHIFYYKRRSVIKKVLELAKQYEQEVFICVLDKKNNKVMQYSSDTKNFTLPQVNQLLQGKNNKNEAQSFSLDNSDVQSLSLISNSTIETKKEPEPKVFQIQKTLELPKLDAKLSLQIPRSAHILDIDEDNDQSEPLAPSKIFFPTGRNSKFRDTPPPVQLGDISAQGEASPKDFSPKVSMFSRVNNPENFYLRYGSRRENDSVDFAQKYLFNNTPNNDNLDGLSQSNEYSQSCRDDCDSLEQFQEESSVNSDNELTNPLAAKQGVYSECKDTQEDGLNENFSDSDEGSQLAINPIRQCKRKIKMERKQTISIPFDIDSIIKKVFVPVESKRIVSAKRYFSQSKNNLKNDNKIQITHKLLKSEASPLGIGKKFNILDVKPVILIDPSVGKSEGCLSPLANANQQNYIYEQASVEQIKPIVKLSQNGSECIKNCSQSK